MTCGRATDRRWFQRPAGSIHLTGLIGLIVVLAAVAAATAQERRAQEPPEIVRIVAPPRLRVGTEGEIRLAYRASQGNVVAVVLAIEDLGGPGVPRSTSEREFGVVARAFGREAGELVVPVSFTTPGWKRVTLTLVTDARELSEREAVEVEAVP